MPEEADWDIATGVGMTALGVAGLRAIESRHAAALVRDPYAAAFVHAAAGQLPTPLPTTPEEAASSGLDFPWMHFAAYVGVRSKFFDTFLGAAAEAGIRQLVIVGAGLDTRAFRLNWPPGVTVYEVDAPLVIAFKDNVLAEQGARARCDRRPVTTDLREDWSAALRLAGFDPGLQAAWIAEGVLPYLSDDATRALLAAVHEQSPPGSRLAVEHLATDLAVLLNNDPAAQEAARRVNWNYAAFLPAESGERRDDPASWLHRNGWAVSVTPAAALAESYGRPLGDAPLEAARASILTSATRSP